jgi:hypothetical protein
MAGGVITRSNHPDALWPGVKAWFGKEYKEWAPLWNQMFEDMDSDKAYEKLIEATGFGMARKKPEGASIEYDSDYEGTINILTHIVWGLGYIVTREEIEDDLYAEVSKSRGKSLTFSIKTTIETVHANVFNFGFTNSAPYLGGDGVPLFSASHPTASGVQSNLLTAADFSETSLEDGLKQIAQTKNARGLNINPTAEKLLVSTYDMFNAERVVATPLRPGTANNDINATRSMGMLPGGVVVNPYLTDTDAWFLKTNVPDGLVSLWRRRPGDLEKDNEFDTENAKAKSTVRFVAGWGDFRGVYGNQGA